MKELIAWSFVVLLSACGAGSTPAEPAAASGVLLVDEIREGPLEPGRYTFTGFEPRIEVEVGQGWEGLHLLSEFWDVVRGEPENLISLYFSRPDLVYGRGLDVNATDADEALAAWQENESLTVGEPRQVTVDGHAGVEVDLINESTELVHVWGGPEGQLGFGPGVGVRVIVLELDEGLLLIGRQGNTASFDRVLTETARLVETLRIIDR